MRKLVLFGLGVILMAFLAYTRFGGLGWGLPYPFHPDERNMAVALEQLECTLNVSSYTLHDCFNPHFFAYGQFPLYLGYILLQFFHFTRDGHFLTPITFIEATLILRLIAAVSSVLTVAVGVGLIRLMSKHIKFINNIIFINFICLLAFIFSPGLIQMAHFGTTESLLVFLYILNIYISLEFVARSLSAKRYILLSAFVCGVAIATKISSLIFLGIPVLLLFNTWREDGISRAIFRSVIVSAMTAVFAIILSPHNIISFQDFISSLRYESAVGLGGADVFYTKQFVETVPVLFQALNIFPYVLGWPVFIVGILGFIFLPYTRIFNVLRFSLILAFIPNAFLYAKWTRFIAPTFPLMILFAVLGLSYLAEKLRIPKKWFVLLIAFMFCLNGIAFFSVYQEDDVRFKASQWLYENIPAGSYILSETANVVDLPINSPQDIFDQTQKSFNSTVISFNFYDLEADSFLQEELAYHIQRADYIVVPSRRVFKNYTCREPELTKTSNSKTKCSVLKKKYPKLDAYYESLFNGSLGFEKIAEFESFPRLNILGKEFIFRDENAEETWTVFEHPVVRVYKKLSK